MDDCPLLRDLRQLCAVVQSDIDKLRVGYDLLIESMVMLEIQELERMFNL